MIIFILSCHSFQATLSLTSAKVRSSARFCRLATAVLFIWAPAIFAHIMNMYLYYTRVHTFALYCFLIELIFWEFDFFCRLCDFWEEFIINISSMGRLFLINLEGRMYTCKHCRTHLAVFSDLISKSFHCSTGKAYLFDKVVNVTTGQKEERKMMTGVHTVVDTFCVRCSALVGWRYEIAHEKSQKYKEGRFILERFKVLGPDGSAYSMGQEDYVSGSEDEV
ncbi:protein yippee-like At3g08990 isoform X2 [Olea europaea var. sylvestris]|nr:protein yippee-like At3g08990 isoform X2 [Olea europaea var. sylvestris]